jgi:hypothetical protein
VGPVRLHDQDGLDGTVYVYYEQFQSPFTFLPPHGTHMLVKSFDGGVSWTRPLSL